MTSTERQQPLAPCAGGGQGPVQLSCKENMGQPLQPSSTTNHPMTRSRRQQQQQQVCALQCTEMELVVGDCVGVVEGVCSHSSAGEVLLPVGNPTAPTTTTIPVAHMDYNPATVSAIGGGGPTTYGSLTAPPPSFGVPTRPPGFDFHPASVASGGIHMLQGGSWHGQTQPAVGGTFTPLPDLQWARSSDLWRRMRAKDVTKVAPETDLRMHHPDILPNMRVILMDWMMEVS